ncbi:hypothetical protein FDP48_12175 [Enterococcus faecalis]|uniref:hypothetical protein n=1 Tax=Enterococcus faecalis TaxID=1351 RepID=UPI0011780690|nr:hypothetical protein [Enterococcus faecalis]EKZ0165418.1 hypothetical protein [Enterococcus faecalis]ELT8948093.1 hypothetical protein [Enterococcus faecalis]MRJ30696.1 hypothetical protein [Enterococcus faecalis]
MKKKKVLLGALGCTVLMFNAMTPVMASTNPVQQYTKDEMGISDQSEDINISTAFPDVSFQSQIKKYDTNKDGFLSQNEISNITKLTLYNISDLTGIKYLTSLKYLEVQDSSITKMDLRGMTSLDRIEYARNNPKLNTLDLRDCDNLVSAHHSVNGETVWISAGMTKFVGCQAVKEHTGDINIDLEGIATVNPDGTKQVNLSTVISSTLLSVFKENTQPGFDPSTNVLTIPADKTQSKYSAGVDSHNKSTIWTFYTNADKPENPTWPDGAPNGWKNFAGQDLTLLDDPDNALFGDYVFYSDQQAAIYKTFVGDEALHEGKYRVTVYAKGISATPPSLPLKVSLKKDPSGGDNRTLLLANPLSSGEQGEKGYYKVSADVDIAADETKPLITVENYQGGYIAGIFIDPIN